MQFTFNKVVVMVPFYLHIKTRAATKYNNGRYLLKERELLYLARKKKIKSNKHVYYV